ncbi:MAG: c-type cytochrome [Pseudomonadota bacterium]
MAFGVAQAQDLRGHGGPVRAIALEDGLVYSGSFDTRAIVWSGTVARQITRAHDGAVTAVLPLPSGGFASGGQDGRVAIWGEGSEPLLFEQWHALPVAAFAPWGDGLASAAWDGQIALWDGSGEPRLFDAHEGQITGLVAYDNGLASVGADLRLRLWDETGAPGDIIGLPAQPSALATDGRTLFVAAPTGALLSITPGNDPVETALGARPLIAVAAGAGLVAVASITGNVWLINPETLRIQAEIATGQGPVWAMALADDELLTGGNDGLIRRWSLEGEPLGEGSSLETATLDGSRGGEVFQACAVCHTLTPDDGARAGPTLHGIFGRRIGTASDYDYSDALLEMDIIWTPQTVSDLFKYGPEAYTPGSRMPEQRVPNADDRAALIEFLEAETQ